MGYDYVDSNYMDVEERLKKLYKVYEEERRNDEILSLERTPIEAFESPVKRTYFDYEDYAREVAEATGGHWTPMFS